MPSICHPEDFLALQPQTTIVDVRSPAEFKKGHIPGAANVPLFDNDERAVIGTLYKQQGRDQAVMRGFEIIGPKMADFVRQVNRLTGRQLNSSDPTAAPVAVHCWRGGMRSQSFAWLLEQAGYSASILDGGYKAYRQHVHQDLAQAF